MRDTTQTVTSNPLVLEAETAADLMTAAPMTIRQDVGLPEALDLLQEKDVHAVPVLDSEGCPVGVLSRTDLVSYFRENRTARSLASNRGEIPSGPAALPRVRELMTPALLSVELTTSAVEVVAHLLGLGNVQQLFVVDDAGMVVGVVSARDVLRRLRRLEVV